MQVYLKGAVLALCLAFSAAAQADTITIDFEGLGDYEGITTQYQSSDVVFTGATALVSGALGGTLNEIDFPPHSGDTVAFADLATLEVSFLRPVVRVVGYFTYSGGPVTLTGRVGGTDVASATSTNVANLGAPAANERIELADVTGFTSLFIAGAPDLQLTLDDLEITFGDAPANPMPEPSLTLLAGVALVAAARVRRRS